MTPTVDPGDFVVAALALAAALATWRQRRRARVAVPAPLTAEERRLLRRRLPWLRLLTAGQRRRHERQVREFLHDIRFSSDDGNPVARERQLAIAGMACLLLLRPATLTFRELRSVRIAVREDDAGPGFGPSSQWPPALSAPGTQVVLDPQAIEQGLAGGPRNELVRAFTPLIGDDRPGSPGAFALAAQGDWSPLMVAARDELARQRSPLIGPSATVTAESFFVAASEAYFQSGAELARRHPRLYAGLRDYYGIETARLAVPAAVGGR